MRRALCGLTVCVPVVPQALHLPVRQDLEVVPAVHTVQLRQPPVFSREMAVRCLQLKSSRAVIRHRATQPRIQAGDPGRLRGAIRRLCPPAVVRCLKARIRARKRTGWSGCAFPTPALSNGAMCPKERCLQTFMFMSTN